MFRGSERRFGEREHRSPGLSLIIAHLKSERKQHVLDLGSATTPTVGFLSELQCKLYVEQLASSLEEIDTAGEDASAIINRLPYYARGLLFDVVLAWDLLNYLKPPTLVALIGRLLPFCKQGTLLFALISTGKRIPSVPVRFKIVGEDRLRYDLSVDRLRDGPRYSTPTLLKMLPGFKVVRSYLLQNNLQEYVLRFE